MPSWREIAKAKVTERDKLFPAEWLIPLSKFPDPSVKDVRPIVPQLLSPSERVITDTLAHQIIQKLASGVWTAEEVTRAFCHRATVVHQLTNALTEVFFDKAMQRARELDKYFAETGGKTVGPLHGLPVSLKDQFNIEGIPCSMGYVAHVNRMPQQNSVLAQALLDAGAVLYVRTNIPQALMLWSTVNNLFGETCHPANRTLTPGGSSGGEAALILAGGSPLGVGTDLGGSLRDPCSWCGLYGLRPSHGRIPYEGAENSMFGQESIRSCAGPMARSVEDIELFYKAIIGQKTWTEDPQVLPIPWREVPMQTTYHFGVILDDGREDSHYHPPVKRALNLVVEKLRAQGHEVIEVEAFQFARQHDLAEKLYFADGGKEIKRVLDQVGEPWVDKLRPMMGRPTPELGVLEYWDLNAERDAYRTEFTDWWNQTNAKFETRRMDGLLCTGLSTSAVPLTAPDAAPWESTGYLVPLLDFVGGVVPVLQVDKNIDKRDSHYKPKNDLDRQLYDMYDPEAFEGGYCGIQVVGRRLEEEKVLNMMKKIDEALKK